MPGPFVPQGELETFNVVKEVTFGVKPSFANAIAHCFNQFQAKPMYEPVQRAPRASLFQPYPGPGGRSVSSSFDPEPTADTIPQLLAYTLGGQAVDPLGGGTPLYSSTLTATVATSATFVPVATSVFVCAGQVITMGSDTYLCTGIVGPNQIGITPVATKSYSNGSNIKVGVGTGTTAHLNLIYPASPLPSFTCQITRPSGVSTDYLGSAVDQLTLSMAPKAGLSAKFAFCHQQATTDGSPAAATLSDHMPYIFEQQNTYAQVGGEVMGLGLGTSSLLGWSITINNNLFKNWWVFGGGNLVRSFPEQLRKVSGQFTIGMEGSTQLSNFDQAAAGGNMPSISAIIPLVNTDAIGSGTSPFALGIWLPRLFVKGFNIDDNTSKMVTATIDWEAGHTQAGTNGLVDTIQFYSDTAATTSY